VRQNAGALAIAFERADDVQEVGAIALRAEMLEAAVGVVERVDAVHPALVAEGRICDDVIEGLESVALHEFGIGQRVALFDERRGALCKIMAASFSCPLSVTSARA